MTMSDIIPPEIAEKVLRAMSAMTLERVSNSGMVGLSLPAPPSVNRRLRNSGVTHPTLRAWRETAGKLILVQRASQRHAIKRAYDVDGAQVDVSIDLTWVDGDVDNRVKPILDLLQATGLVVNDKNVRTVCVSRSGALQEMELADTLRNLSKVNAGISTDMIGRPFAGVLVGHAGMLDALATSRFLRYLSMIEANDGTKH